MSPVRLSFFGPPCIEWDGNKREKLEPLPVGILAYLAVERHEHRRDDVANLFWPDAKDPRGTFRRQLPGLKKLIGKSRLLSNSGAIGLNFDSDIWIDVNRFSDLLTECKTHAHSEDDACPNCLDLLLEAEKLSSRGSFLRGHKLRNSTSEFERWYDDFARELNDQRHNVSERLVRYYLKDGSLKSAQEYAKRWKEVDGLDETVYRYRMWIYAQQGQRVRALNEYETFVRIFDGEEKFLSTEIKVLRDAIKNNQIPSLDEFLGSETKIKNGDQTCLDIPAVTSPIRLGEQTDKPCEPPFQAPPKPLHELIGRDELLEDLKQQLFTGNHLAITALRGLPGVGKTTLAVELAHDPDVQEILVDGVLWVGLGRQPDVMAQLGRWATAVGISLHGIAELNTVEERANAIHDAIGRRRLLLVVDDAWCSEEAAAFKVGGPNCAYLITTRLPEVAIQFAGNNYTVVGELNEANSLALLTQLAPKIVKQEPDDALKLVQEVGGLPLGIILIGNYLCLKASCRHPRRIKDALKQLHNTEYRLRSISQPKSPLEHPGLSFGTKISLEAVIAVSDEALDQPSQYTLRALSVFPPKPNTFSEEAALAVTGQTKDILDRLTDAGLLEYSGNGRYTLHQTIADYARLKLTDEAVYQRMVNYFGGGSELGLHF